MSDKCQMRLRMKLELRSAIEASAKKRGVTLNAETVRRLEASFRDDERTSIVARLEALEKRTGWLEEITVPEGHASDCAVYNPPAYPPGPCDCGYTKPASPDEPPISAEDVKALRMSAKCIQFWAKDSNAPEAMMSHLENILSILGESGGCDHEWVSADNEVVSGAEICLKCNTIRGAQ